MREHFASKLNHESADAVINLLRLQNQVEFKVKLKIKNAVLARLFSHFHATGRTSIAFSFYLSNIGNFKPKRLAQSIAN